jgi:hypothetical protein
MDLGTLEVPMARYNLGRNNLLWGKHDKNIHGKER